MKNKRGIPEIRIRLIELADEHGIDELRELAAEMHRTRAIKISKPTSTPVTPEIAEKIRDFAAKNPHLQQRHIADHFNVNSGRVSESLNRLR